MTKAAHGHPSADLWEPKAGEMVYSVCPKCMAALKVLAAMRLPAKWFKKPCAAYRKLYPDFPFVTHPNE